MQSLNGSWQAAVDGQNAGRLERWFESVQPQALGIPVPGVVQQVFPTFQGVCWYWRHFTPDRLPGPGERALLCFGAVEYQAEVWLNGVSVGGHEGAEFPFELDVSAALRAHENLLAVRVVKPGDERVDGFTLREIPHRNEYDHARFQPGMSYNIAGLTGAVQLTIVPVVRVAGVFAQADVEPLLRQAQGEHGALSSFHGEPVALRHAQDDHGEPVALRHAQDDHGEPVEPSVLRRTSSALPPAQVTVRVTMSNATNETAHETLRVVVAPSAGGAEVASAEQAVTLPPGDSTHIVQLTITHPHLWDIDDPYLYRATASLADAGQYLPDHSHTVRFGLRDFRVVEGFFRLNGRRLFLRSSHTGNHFPVGQIVPPTPDLLRRDLLMAKAAGLNCVRFIAGAAWPEQLDFCDEIGLLVYEECYASWCLEDSPHMTERYERSYGEMIRRDRNHPSVTIWGLINEMPDGPAFRCAVSYLPKLRELDGTRLVLLGSGRWDGQPGIGSVSNPGTREWQPMWGIEAPQAPPVDAKLTWQPGGYTDRAGDAHVYPTYPLEQRNAHLIRTLGEGMQPVFLSEFGIGSMMNVVEEARGYDALDVPDNLPDRTLIRSMAERLTNDLRRFKLDEVYPFPADLLRDSYRLHSFQRRLAFDLIRSNPNLAGYNLTGLLDHGITGEGLWSFWRHWKSDIVATLEDGWSPLRWCLFVDPPFAYSDRPLGFEAVLANDGVLAPGEYPVQFRIWGEGRCVWERRARVRVPSDSPLSVPVLKTRVRINLPPGEYVFAADLQHGGAPTGDRLPFRVADSANMPRGRATLLAWGVEQRLKQWLGALGYTVRDYDPLAARARSLILVGDVRPTARNQTSWTALRRRIEDEGARVLVLSAGPFRSRSVNNAETVQPEQLPWGDWLRARRFHDWLYHKEVLARRHAIFAGLPAGGLLDWYVYGQVAGGDCFDCVETPQEVIAASFAAGYSCPGGYDSAVVIGATTLGKGRVTFNALHLLEQLGRHPAADRLLANMVAWAVAT